MKRIVLLAFVCLFAVNITAQEDPTITISPTLSAQLDALEARVESLRGLTLTNPIERVFPTPEDILTYVNAIYAPQLTDEIVTRETHFYVAFDFFGRDIDLKAVYLELLSSQIAGFYDTETKQMNTVLFSGRTPGDFLPLLEQIIYAHEYTHALQDQHFDLGIYLEAIEENPDVYLARLALVEGDATLVMQGYLEALVDEQPLIILGALGQIMSLSDSGLMEIPEGTPEILETELMMAYLDGLTFVAALYDEGGWDAVNVAFANPPRSTEQVLHPQRYFDLDEPVQVFLQNPDHVFDSGWELVMERTLGEFYLREYLLTQLDNNAARQAAEGWGGDRYRLYYNDAADEYAWILHLTWDTSSDADEFASAYARFAQQRMDADATPEGGTQCWLDANIQETLCLLHDGSDTLIAFAPDATMAVDLIASQR